MTSYNIALLGDGGVGKTTFVNVVRSIPFEPRYTNTLGHEVHPVSVNTNRGPITLNIWDISGQQLPILHPSMNQMHLAIIMYGVDSKTSYNHANYNWLNIANGTPSIMVATKSDIDTRSVVTTDLHVSMKNPTSVRAVLLAVVRRLLGDDTVEILDVN